MSSLLVLNPFLGGWGRQVEGRKGEKRTLVEPVAGGQHFIQVASGRETQRQNLAW